MIKFENTEVYGWDAAIRGMRNPMNSWDKSDSHSNYEFVFSNDMGASFAYCEKDLVELISNGILEKHEMYIADNFIIGKNDLNLMKNLVRAGTDHSKFMRMINVTVDITAPRYWWTEFDTYKVGTVRNSCSTMHKIHAKEFTLDDFSHEHLIPETIEDEICHVSPLYALESHIELLNYYRKRFIETKDKKWWWQMIQLLPQSYNQRATVQLNYAVLRSIYHSDRKHHKLDEWRTGFMEWIESLPYSELITGDFF